MKSNKLSVEKFKPYIGNQIGSVNNDSIRLVGIVPETNVILCFSLTGKCLHLPVNAPHLIDDNIPEVMFSFRRLSSITDAIHFNERTFLPIRELQRRFSHIVPQNIEGGFKRWLFDLIRKGKVIDAPYCIVCKLCEWGFWIYEDDYFMDGTFTDKKD